LENSYIARLLAHDRSDLAHVEAAQYPEEDHLGLISRQAGTNKPHGRVGSECVNSRDRRVIVGGALAQVFRCHSHASSPALAPSPVDETVPRDREHPRPELLVVAMKAREVSSGREPGVGLDIFGCHRIEPSQEPEQPRVQVPPENSDRPLRALLGGCEYLVELGRGHVSRVPSRASFVDVARDRMTNSLLASIERIGVAPERTIQMVQQP
jgi:hypothetical protein